MLDIDTRHSQRGMGDLVVEPADPDDIKKRRKNMLRKRLPHLAAECDGRIVGYAYAVPFRKRPAYRYTVKHSIYIHPDFVGVGRSEEHTSELQSLMRISYAVFCLKKQIQ